VFTLPAKRYHITNYTMFALYFHNNLPGSTGTTEKLGSVHTYPYNEVNPAGPDRTHAQHHRTSN